MVLELRQTGGRFFFSALREGDEIKFATDDDNERHSWVQALYRATGQAHKPVPPKQDATLQKPSSGEFSWMLIFDGCFSPISGAI